MNCSYFLRWEYSQPFAFDDGSLAGGIKMGSQAVAKSARVVGGVLAGLLMAGSASAHTVTSNQPDCDGTNTLHEFSITATTVVKCLTKGGGNINGNGDAINALGYTLLDKSDVGGNLLEGTLGIVGNN
jgi:hypothetical protein